MKEMRNPIIRSGLALAVAALCLLAVSCLIINGSVHERKLLSRWHRRDQYQRMKAAKGKEPARPSMAALSR